MNLNKGISTPIAILLIVLVAAVAGVAIWQFRSPEQPAPKQVSDYTTQSTCEGAGYYWYGQACHKNKSDEMLSRSDYPEEYLIYRDYWEAIDANPDALAGIGIIEGTVVSLTKDQFCPTEERDVKDCNIEPYPKDTGVVRIDKIVEYTPYSERPAEQPLEQPSGAESPSQGEETPGNKGTPPDTDKEPNYESLQEGEKFPALFILTAGEVEVRHVAMPSDGEPEPVEPEPETQQEKTSSEEPVGHSVGGGKTAEQPINGEEPTPETYKPLPKENGEYVFTTKIVDPNQVSQNMLSGLEEGSKFRAEIKYDGTLYIETYQPL